MVEEQPAEGIEGLGRRLWHAQSGRYFLFKWVLISAAGQALSIPIRLLLSPMRGSLVSWWFWAAYLSPPILIAAFQAFVLFRWRWRMWFWIGLHLIGAFSPSAWRFAYVWLILPLFETPLFIGIRKRPWLWALCCIIGTEMHYTLGVTWWSWTNNLRAWFAVNAPVLGWIDPAKIAFQSVDFLTVLIAGATFAWLMPPVSSAMSSDEIND